MAPANTGNASSNKMVVINTDQINRGTLSNLVFLDRMLRIVVMKLIAPKMEETPARCNLKMARSILLVA